MMNIKNIRLKITSILLFTILFLSLNLSAQWSDIRFSHLSSEDGLSQIGGNCIIQDEKGFVWIGTEDGLNVYDGHKISSYKPENNNPQSLSNGFILSICEDKSGILWIGTENGLNRFDPSEEKFKRYFHDPDDLNSLSNNRVLSICEDQFGSIWVGTECGLNILDPERKEIKRYYSFPDNPNSISHNYIKAIYEDKSGTLWIGTYGGGFNEYDREKSRFLHYMSVPDDTTCLSDNNVLALLEDHEGMLWIGTEDGGLNKFDRKSGLFTQYVNNQKDPNSISSNHINIMHEDKTGVLWIGTRDSGLNMFNRKKNRFISYKVNPNNPASISDNTILSICEDRNGGLWFGTYSGGLNIFNRETQRFIHYKYDPDNPNSLSYKAVRPIYEDSLGILWLGTDGGGLNKFDRENEIFTHYKNNPNDPHSLSDNRVFAICEDKNSTFWIGTHGGGLNKFNCITDRFKRFKSDPNDSNSLSDNKIRNIVKDRSDKFLWIGTNGGGLNKFDIESERFTHYKNEQNNPNSLSNNRIYCMFQDRSDILWIGTFGGGLSALNPKNGQFTCYQVDTNNVNSINKNFILSIYEDSKGLLWVGTLGGGLNRIDRGKNIFKHYTENDGLPSNVIYDILEDGRGNLWMSTNRGVSNFNPKTEKFKNYDIKDGLQNNEFNTGTGHTSRSGEMFFGGVNGFNSFFPDSIRDNPFEPPIVITSFQLFNKPVPIGEMGDGRIILESSIKETKKIRLSHLDKVFSFEFAALNFIFPDRNQYAYKMEGFEKEWNYVGNRNYVTYTSLSPGNYVFRVKGSNNDGIWNENGTSLKIEIVPPFWKTWWFYTLCIIIFVFSIAAVFIYQINKIKKKKEEEERRKVTGVFSQVLEHGDAAVYRRKFDSDIYEYMGAGIKDITGYDPHEFSLSFWDEITVGTEMVGELAGLREEEVLKRVRKGSIDRWVADLKIRTKSGEIRWARDMTTALRDEWGVCYGCFGIVFDITDRKLAEQKLANTTMDLRKSSEELRSKNKEMEKDLDMAREVQMALLSQHYPKNFPKNVPVEQSALEFSHRYIPASTLAGDFFEIFPISDTKIGVMIYDVMGHGVRASLLTAYLHGIIEEIIPIASDSVAFMKKLNSGLGAIMEQFFSGMFATAFYLVADVEKGTIQFTNAGHPLPFLLKRSSGVVERLNCDGKRSEPALGLFKDCNYTSYEELVSDDDIVLIFTDGIFEVENKDRSLYGEKRLFAKVKNQLHSPPEQMLDEILSDINNFSGTGVFNDDVCIVSMHVKKASFK